MKKHIKYLVLLTISLMIIIGIANAQPIPIGMTVQPVPFESNPTAFAETIGGIGDKSAVASMYDQDLFTSGWFLMGGSMGSSQYFELNTFRRPSDLGIVEDWDPEWVEIKMKYQVPSPTNDDKYKIQYSTDGVTWLDLQPDVSGAASKFDLAIRPWSQLAEPQDGSWTWADVVALRVRVTCTKAGLGWDSKKMYITELWATVYPAPLPPASPTSVSVQPPAVTRLRPYDYTLGGAQGICFVDLYVNDVIDMFTYEIWLEFDTAVLTPYEVWQYYPWFRQLAPDDLDDANGYVRIAYGMASGTPIGEGFTGSSPFARIYFIVDAYGGGGGGSAYGGLMGTTDITIRRPYPDSFLGDTTGVEITADYYNGWFSGSHYMSFAGGTLPMGNTTSTDWHELYPDYSKNWHLTSWEDTNLDGHLSTSDQIDMTNETGWTYWFHVDEVTVTIWWTVKLPDPEVEGAAHPMEPYPLEYQEPDVGWYENPIGTYWHVISPPEDFCRWIQITSWDDTDGSGTFTASDQFDFYYLDEEIEYWAHLDEVTTDILVSQKPIPPDPPSLEFPFGVSLIMLIAPIIPLIYLWRLRKKVTKQ